MPKVSVNAVRSGVPYKITKTPSICHLYLDIRVAPDQTPALRRAGTASRPRGDGCPMTIEPFVFRRGYEAQNVEPLVAKVEAAHRRIFGETPGRPVDAVTSMWRDSNVFKEAGIPTVVYGPGASVGGGNFAMEVDALVQAAKAYAAIAIEVCGTEHADSEEVER